MDLEAILERKLKRRPFGLSGPLTVQELELYDRAVRYYRCTSQYADIADQLKPVALVEYGLYRVKLHRDMQRTGNI